MLTEREAFKAGFLKRAADDGFTTEETLALVKTANGLLTALGSAASGIGSFLGTRAGKLVDSTTGMVGDAVKGIGTSLAGISPYALIGAPIAGGAGLGYLAAKASDLNDEDPDEIKTRELIDEYSRAIEQAHMSRAHKDQATSKYGRPVI